MYPHSFVTVCMSRFLFKSKTFKFVIYLSINEQRTKKLKAKLFYRDQNNVDSETPISEYYLMDLPFHYILEVLRQVFILVIHDCILH